MKKTLIVIGIIVVVLFACIIIKMQSNKNGIQHKTMENGTEIQKSVDIKKLEAECDIHISYDNGIQTFYALKSGYFVLINTKTNEIHRVGWESKDDPENRDRIFDVTYNINTSYISNETINQLLDMIKTSTGRDKNIIGYYRVRYNDIETELNELPFEY